MKFELEEYHRNTKDEELIVDLQRVASELNKVSVTRAEQDEMGRFHSTTYIRRFGSWSKALEKAGFENMHQRNFSEEQLFKNLEEIWIRLGRQPKYSDIQKPFSKYSVFTYARRFGGWHKALEKFVAFINTEENYSSEEALGKLEIEPKRNIKASRTINWRIRFIVMRRDNFRCKNCGRSPATDPSVILHVDHLKAWVNGGETVLENLQTLCSICNIGKSNLE